MALLTNTAEETGFVLDHKIYPQKKENHGNRCDSLINPIIVSLKISTIYAKLYIGIDHPVRKRLSKNMRI